MNNIIPLKDIQSLTQEKAKELFPTPKKYNHIPGVEFEPYPKWIEFKDIRTLGTEKNVGRTQEHTQEQIQQLKESFSKGVQTWQELPCSSSLNKDNQFTDKQIFGFGRTESLESLGLTGYWFHVLKPTDSYTESWVSVIENLELSPKFSEGEKLLAMQLCRLIADGTIANDEDSIETELDKMVSNISKTSKGRIREVVFSTNDTPLRYSTWGAAKVAKWLREEAAISFKMNGKYDPDRKKYGFLSKNVQDPLHNAIMKYAETKKKSYVVLHVNAPNGSGDLSKLRMNEAKKLADYIAAYRTLGIEDCPLEILGFMWQDNGLDLSKTRIEDKRYLVDINGTTTIK